MKQAQLRTFNLFYLFILIISSVIPAFSQEKGTFVKLYWFEKGIEHGNPMFNSRFRVNAPESVLHESFGKRSETRGNGMMQILMEESLFEIEAPILYMELWGGHPGTANKRVTINGRSTYQIPDEHTEQKHCTYTYPHIQLKLTDMVNGYNALQFACDQGETFWGHYIVDNAALVVPLKKEHPALKDTEFGKFQAQVKADVQKNGRITLTLDVPESFTDKIAKVYYQGFYEGYDENGDGRTQDFHSFTRNREAVASIGLATEPPFTVDWDTSMLPAQEKTLIQASIHFKETENLYYFTPVLPGPEINHDDSIQVKLYTPVSDALPAPFWSRANRKTSCSINIDVPLEKIEKAQLHIVIWDGGKGTTEHPFTLNGKPLDGIAGEGHHDLLYRIIDLDPSILKQGENVLKLVSDTEHHGIEVIYPGPAIMIRSRIEN
jgi:hypothetical protein